ncbi:MAG: dTDP-4-dehydrorhamnose reductase [Planctomycetes bacterium]|nr:dTDP-4-dehydrorhamnose reductase [Planctomycetota bacterium]MCP4771005.1 dTDP-4-dehydrorhamnose reductase [Planctomycetota bacterium]MCP4861724.1 dTDP-4-dehydrorhamnose reductase [Planctomycetota bacterium]
MPEQKRFLVTGRNGQLGHECGLIAPQGYDLVRVGREEMDLSDHAQIAKVIREVQPSFILHGAAWTAVDLAEEKEQEAFAINATAAEVMASCAAEIDARLAFVSTDYVFSGEGDAPWREDDPVAPLNAYGRSKLAGEQAVLGILGERGHVVRTSWVYGRRGNNFVRTMLRFMEQGRALKVVDDQLGSPTWAGGLAVALIALGLGENAPSILHYTDGGIISWCDFAQEIRACGIRNGLALEESSVNPCPSTEYPTPAARPSWSPMHFSSAWEGLGITQSTWQDALQLALPLLLRENDKVT